MPSLASYDFTTPILRQQPSTRTDLCGYAPIGFLIAQCANLGMPKQKTLIAYLNEYLADIDEALSKRGVPVSKRPMEAACFFVEHNIREIKGDTKENYLLKPWFASIFRATQDWYKSRYGEPQVHPQPVLTGAVRHYGAFFLLRIPMMIAKPGGDGTCWLTFPKDVLLGEDPTSWIIDGPALTQMRPKPLQTLQREATNTATWIRGIANDLLTADSLSDPDTKMAASVVHHLNKAAIDMCTQTPEAASLSIWELQMACEKTMKAYLAQASIPYPQTHNLRELNKLAPITHDWTLVKKTLELFPSEQRVMRLRYQEIDGPKPNELWKCYEAALQVCAVYASRLSRSLEFNNFAVQLQRPPWLGSD